MLQLEKKGIAKAFVHESNGYVVVVDEVEPFNQETYKAKKIELAKKLTQERLRLFTEGFVASLYRPATIKLNEQLLNSTINQSRSQSMPNYEE